MSEPIGLFDENNPGWKETARGFARSADYYRGLVVAIGERFGVAARTADDGSISEDVLCAKVPELVTALQRELADCRQALRLAARPLHPVVGYPKDDPLYKRWSDEWKLYEKELNTAVKAHMFWCSSFFADDTRTGVGICNCGVALAARAAASAPGVAREEE